MFNLFAMLTAIIDIAEPAIEDDDTTQFQPVAFTPEPPVMRTHPITTAALIDTNALRGCLVAYRMTTADDWQLGNIMAVEESKFGRVSLYFVPKDETLCPKWRDFGDFVYAVWS